MEEMMKILWHLSGQYKYGWNIYSFLRDLELDNHFGIDCDNLMKCIKQNLVLMSQDNLYVRDACMYGYCPDLDCYWRDSNAETSWCADKPEWWEEVVENE